MNNCIEKLQKDPASAKMLEERYMGPEYNLDELIIIDPVTTDRHFVSNHEMFGTLIKGTGLENIEKTLPKQKNSKGMNMNGMTM